VVTETYTYRPKREAYVESEVGIGEYQRREHTGVSQRVNEYEVSHQDMLYS